VQSFFLKIVVTILCSIFLSISSYGASDKAKLKDVLSQISAVKTDITKKKQKQTSVAQQLKNLKKKILDLEKRVKATTKNLKKQQGILKKLTKEQSSYQLNLNEAQEKLSSQIDSAYRTETTNYFKLILSRDKKVMPDLILSYHKYIFMDRIKQMYDINTTLEHLENNRKKITKEKNWLERIKKKQSQQRKELEKTKQARDKVLRLLKTKIATQSKKLKQLLVAKKRLGKLISRLTIHKKKIVSPKLKAKFCKNFLWPTKGKIVIHFGSPIEKSLWKWNGVVIRTDRNQPVYAISPGKVVYADQLTGYGLLLIVEHENGYMSLYGHNSTLRQGLNAKVNRGDFIATVGKRDGNRHELYFAIRYNGKSIDPEKWCK